MLSSVVLTIHLMIAATLVGVVLLQRSEGGGLGMGSSSGGFMTGRGTANLLTRVTAGLAAAFFVTSISLTLLAKQDARPVSPLDSLPAKSAPSTPGAPAKSEAPATPAGSPTSQPSAPAAPATPDGGVLKGLEGGKAPLPKSK